MNAIKPEYYEIKIYDLLFKGTEIAAKTEYDIFAAKMLNDIINGKQMSYIEFQRWLGIINKENAENKGMLIDIEFINADNFVKIASLKVKESRIFLK